MTRKIFGRIASARSLVFAMASLAALALSAFDTPYLTFRSAASFSLDWTGSSITAGLSDGQYYLYLRGKDNTHINNSTATYSSPFTLSGATADIYCEGDIETLRDYEGNPPAMTNYCYGYLFKGWTKLVSPPTISATTSTEGCYRSMFDYSRCGCLGHLE